MSPETCRAELKRLVNENVVASCWLFTSLYKMMHGDRNINFYKMVSRDFPYVSDIYFHLLKIQNQVAFEKLMTVHVSY